MLADDMIWEFLPKGLKGLFKVVKVDCHATSSLNLDSMHRKKRLPRLSSTGTPDIDWNYRDTFYAKPRYPALDIAYLAVQKEWRGKRIGQYLIEMIAPFCP